MTRRYESYLGGHTVVPPRNRPLEQQIASEAAYEKWNAQRAQETFDHAQQQKRNEVKDFLAEDERLRRERFEQRCKESARFRQRKARKFRSLVRDGQDGFAAP